MKGSVFVLIAGFTTAAIGFEQGALMRQNQRLTKSFLTAQTFPKTFEDLSFADKVAIWQEGYEPFESEYDSTGRCIKNCAYVGITIQEEERASQQATEELQELAQEQESAAGQIGTVAKFFGPPVKDVPIKISSDFGKRDIRGKGSVYHHGIDISVLEGTPVYAVSNGKVITAGSKTGYGRVVEIEHYVKNHRIVTTYAHLNDYVVKPGDIIQADDLIGHSGNTGTSTGPHLHYGIKLDGKSVDPLGSKIKPELKKKKESNAAYNAGVNFLGAKYCFQPGVSSNRVAGKSDEYLRNNFPGCTGWCDN